MQRARAREVAAATQLSISLLRRRIRDTTVDEALTSPALRALSRLDRGGPATTADLARLEQMTPQAMGTIVAQLDELGLVSRSPDPQDGRRTILTPTSDGKRAAHSRRNALTERFTDTLMTGFTDDELEVLRAAAPLLERLAQQL